MREVLWRWATSGERRKPVASIELPPRYPATADSSALLVPHLAFATHGPRLVHRRLTYSILAEP